MKAKLFSAVAYLGVFGAALLGAATPATAATLDLDRIFLCAGEDEASGAICGEARGIIMFTCQGCHAFVRVVRARFEPAGWAGVIDRHRTRVAGKLTNEELEHLQSYLTANFRLGVPPPELPPNF